MAKKLPARDPGPQGLPTRSRKKRLAIVAAGGALFLEKGYLGTTMDEIAAVAGVSKQTVYKHFADKEALFVEMVTGTIDVVSQPFHDALGAFHETDALERDLRALAKRLVHIVLQPEVLRLRRLVIGEAARFPELGRLYLERAPGRTVTGLAELFERLAGRGLLRVDDPRTAAAHFVWLVLSIPLNEAMLTGDLERFTAGELDRFAESGAAAFFRAYGRP